MADIFISYKSERRPAARHLKKVLECYFQTGADECVWYDYGLVPGHDFEPRIMAEIAKAKVVLVLWCGMAVKSEWVAKEAREAQRTAKFLPVRIESCALPAAFANADTINLADWDASPRSPMLDRVLDELGRRLGRDAISRIAQLRELEEDWRGYGAPSLAHFALGKALEPSTEAPTPLPLPTTAPILGQPPTGVSTNLALHWENAQNGDAAALFEVAWAYDYPDGKGLISDHREAARLYKLAADQGHAGAQCNLGVMYAKGMGGLPKDDREAVRLFKLAASQGNARSQSQLGFMYAKGMGGLSKDEREAARLYQLAADQGDTRAQYDLGVMYAKGRGGLPKDEREAVRRYQLAVDQGFKLVDLLWFGERPGPLQEEEKREAVRLYQLAVNHGNADAQYNLAHLHHFGYAGAPKDEFEAVRLYKLAADQGQAGAQYTLGQMYEEGRGGLPKDDGEAVRLYKLAARGGDEIVRELAQTTLRERSESW